MWSEIFSDITAGYPKKNKKIATGWSEKQTPDTPPTNFSNGIALTQKAHGRWKCPLQPERNPTLPGASIREFSVFCLQQSAWADFLRLQQQIAQQGSQQDEEEKEMYHCMVCGEQHESIVWMEKHMQSHKTVSSTFG